MGAYEKRVAAPKAAGKQTINSVTEALASAAEDVQTVTGFWNISPAETQPEQQQEQPTAQPQQPSQGVAAIVEHEETAGGQFVACLGQSDPFFKKHRLHTQEPMV